VIFENQFPQFQKEAEEVDKSLMYVNMWIKRSICNDYNMGGVIFIRETNDPVEFMAKLSHEAGHSAIDPVTTLSYIKCCAKIVEELNVTEREASVIGNIISDMIVTYGIAKDPRLRDAWKYYLEKLVRQFANQWSPRKKFLAAVCDRLLNSNLNLADAFADKFQKDFGDKFKKLVDRAASIVRRPMPREEKYVELAKIIDQIPNLGHAGISSTSPILPRDQKEVEEIVRELAKESEYVGELKKYVEIMSGCGISGTDWLYRGNNLMQYYYQTKADMLRGFISYPKEPSRRHTEVGSRKWSLSHGVMLMDHKKTLFKHGVNIPLVTTRSKTGFSLDFPGIRGERPIDIVLSLDVSGSMQAPSGGMAFPADHLVVLTYALIDEAARKGQGVGLLMWSHMTKFSTLPNVMRGPDLQRLKKDVLNYENWGGDTDIKIPLNHAEKHPDLLFIVITDGEVHFADLRNVNNCMFFLVTKSEHIVNKFVDVYGSERAIMVESWDRLPKVVVSWFRRSL